MPRNIDYLTAFGDKKDDHREFSDTWHNNGFNAPTQAQLSWDDMIATPNAQYWLPKVVEDIIREPVEPMLVVPSILDHVQFSAGARITFPAMGAIKAYDLAEGQSYPEEQLQVAPGTMTINIGKSGLAVKITEEMRRYSQFDVINMHLRAGRRALDRHKERKGMDYITAMGVTIFDNINPTSSVYGSCTGRSLTGAGNGSCRMEDLLKAYAHVMMQGFVPDTLLMHPLTWSMWMADPLLQTIVKNTGNGAWFQRHEIARQGQPWANASQNKMGMGSGYGAFTPTGNAASETPTGVKEVDQNLSSAPQIPGYFPHPLSVLVSPFVPFYTHNNTCDIMIFDSSNLGALVVDEEVMTDQWEDLSADILKIKMRERYAFAIYEEGLGIGVLRNVPIRANEIAFPAQATISATGEYDELDPTAAISGL